MTEKTVKSSSLKFLHCTLDKLAQRPNSDTGNYINTERISTMCPHQLTNAGFEFSPLSVAFTVENIKPQKKTKKLYKFDNIFFAV